MAFVATYTFTDGKNETSTTDVNLPASVNFDDAVGFVQALGVFINLLTTGKITRVGLAFNVPITVGMGSLVPAAGNSDVQEGARFQFRTDGGFFSRLRLPTFDETFIVPGGKTVDIEDDAVDDFITAMTDGLTVNGNLVTPCDTREDDLASLSFAKEAFTASRGD